MTIKILTGVIIGALGVAGSAVAAVEWMECPGSARPQSYDPAKCSGELVVLVPRVGGQPAVGAVSLIPRQPQVVVLTPRRRSTAN
jgi:hypothetical protein